MQYEPKDIKRKLSDYFHGIITKDELGKWAEIQYYDLLKGGYVELQNIIVYPFLKKISQYHILENDIKDIYPCPLEEIKKIYDILCGNQNYDFFIEMGIPEQVYSMFFEKEYFNQEYRKRYVFLWECLIKYKENGKIHYDFEDQFKEILFEKKKENTIIDVIGNQIELLLRLSFDIDSDGIEKGSHLRVYPIKKNENNMLEKLLQYLEVIIGLRNMNILVSYHNGKATVQVLI